MRFIRPAAALLGLCLATASFTALADNTGPDLEAIRAQQIELRAEAMAAKGIFKTMEDRDRERLIARQNQLLALLDDKAALADFEDREQVLAFNLLEEINAIINHVEGEQVVCEYVRKTGSHRKSKQCTTVAQKRQLQQETEDLLRQEHMRGLGNAIGN